MAVSVVLLIIRSNASAVHVAAIAVVRDVVNRWQLEARFGGALLRPLATCERTSILCAKLVFV